MYVEESSEAVIEGRETTADSTVTAVNTGHVDPSRPYATSLTFADLPDEVERRLDLDVPLQEPPQQGRTSRVAFAFDVAGGPVVLKRSVGSHLEVLRREHRALLAVHPLGGPTPEPLLFFERSASFGVEGWLVTRRLVGTTLAAALDGALDRDRRASLLADFGAVVARLHATPPPPGFGSHDWLDHALLVANSLNPAADEARLAQLRNERPAPVPLTLLHGDLFLDNVLTADGRVTGLIDWSFADVGDPRYDVAVATHELTRFDREAFAEGYGPAALLTSREEAYFVEIALLF